MHSWTIVGAVLLFFFSSNSLTLPLSLRGERKPFELLCVKYTDKTGLQLQAIRQPQSLSDDGSPLAFYPEYLGRKSLTPS